MFELKGVIDPTDDLAASALPTNSNPDQRKKIGKLLCLALVGYEQ